ncbi:nucleoside 2-deoxyribosyltransferase [Bacillus altitudinis]|uniref:nucleoside 2-deoxyribosyltransferase n=1 Tax=Bacillus altitudinis TaxID=293387 RepID=UPI003899A655
MRVYLASPFFSDEQLNTVKRVEEALEQNDTVSEYFSPRQQQLDHIPFGTPEWSREIFKNDVNYIDWADVVVGVIDFDGKTVLHGETHGHVDSGTAWELGYAFATRKPVILIHEKGGIVNLMISESCQAYLQNVEALTHYDFSSQESIRFTGKVL